MTRSVLLAFLGLACCTTEPPASEPGPPQPDVEARAEPLSEPRAEPEAAEPGTSEPAAFDPAAVPAPAWIDPTPGPRSREAVGDSTTLLAIADCELELEWGWFAACEAAEAWLAELEPIGNGSPGPSDARSKLGAVHVDDPAPAVRLASSWLLASHPASVLNQRSPSPPNWSEFAGVPPNWSRLATALELEEDPEVLAFMLGAFARADELPAEIVDRVTSVAERGLGHSRVGVRLAAIAALTQPDARARPQAFQPIARAAALDVDPLVRARACARLGLFGDVTVEPWLLAHAGDPGCLEGALELAVHGSPATGERAAALLERVSTATIPTSRTLRLLARAAGRDGATFERDRLLAVFEAPLAATDADLRVRDAATWARFTLDPRAGPAAVDNPNSIVPSKLSRREAAPEFIGWIDAGTWVPSGEDPGAMWDAAIDRHVLVLTPRGDLRAQPIDPENELVRTLMAPPSLITLVADAAAAGRRLPKVALDQADASVDPFDVLADGYTIGWPKLSPANLRELGEFYEALRVAAPRGPDAVIELGVERILASDLGFFAERRSRVALVVETRQTFGWCWQAWTKPCETLTDPTLVATISAKILAARLTQGDVGISSYDVSRRRVRAELVALLGQLVPRVPVGGGSATTRVWVEITGPFIHAGTRGDPSAWLDALELELAAADIDAQRVRWWVDDASVGLARRLEERDVWARPAD